MGGVDKGLMLWHGRQLGLIACDALRPDVAWLAVSANRHEAQWTRLTGVPVIRDLRPLHQGPLAGLEAALMTCPLPWLLVRPCDTPQLPPYLTERLVAMARSGPATLAVHAASPQGEHPLCLLVHRDALPHISDALDAGNRRVMAVLAAIGSAIVRFEDDEPFRNINCLDEPGLCGVSSS
jgi:molybdopterin-guanine dinucleotide biosynthesis protein A